MSSSSISLFDSSLSPCLLSLPYSWCLHLCPLPRHLHSRRPRIDVAIICFTRLFLSGFTLGTKSVGIKTIVVITHVFSSLLFSSIFDSGENLRQDSGGRFAGCLCRIPVVGLASTNYIPSWGEQRVHQKFCIHEDFLSPRVVNKDD
jgi:hypothetical protein